jgi:hypothetical protein
MGFIVLSGIVCVEIYKYVLSFAGGAPAEELKLLFLLLFVWLLLESAKKLSVEANTPASC